MSGSRRAGSDLKPLGEVVRVLRKRVKPNDADGLPFVGMEHVEAHTMRLLGTVPATTMKSAAVRFEPGDVLYGRLRPYLNKVYRPTFAGLGSAEFIVMTPTPRLDGDYLRYFLNSSDFVAYASRLNTGDRPRVDFDQLAEFLIPVPSLASQRSTVAAIEELLAHLDAATGSLEHSMTLAAAYRRAVLAAASVGRLRVTETSLPGRSASSTTVVHGLKNPRRRAGRLWGSGSVPELLDAERAAFPVSWQWAKVRDLGQDPESTVQVGPMSLRSRDFVADGVPVLNVGSVQWGRIDDTRVNFLPSALASRFARYRVQSGDVLFTRSGTVGRCAVALPRHDDWLMTFHLLRVRADARKCLPEFLRIILEGAPHIRRQTRAASIGTTRAGFNTNLLADLDVPIPPVGVQQSIVSEVERQLSVLDGVVGQVKLARERSQAVRRAVLQSAFDGSLQAAGTASE